MPEEKTQIPPELYTRDYYLTDNDGHRQYAMGLDNNIHHCFVKALELGQIKESDRVLDLGCGRGELVYYAVKKGAKALGIDYSSDAVDLTHETIKRLPKELQANADAKCANLESFDFQHKYNVIFMLEVVEHLYDYQLDMTFNKLNEILADDGRIVIMTPNYLYEKYLQPWKYFLDIPCRLFKWPLRILRGKYKPKNFKELIGKIFKIKTDRGSLCRQMHCNIVTPKRLKTMLRNFDAEIWCEDHSLAPISLLLKKWMGLEIIAIAKKKNDHAQ